MVVLPLPPFGEQRTTVRGVRGDAAAMAMPP